MWVLSEIDSRALCYQVFAQVVRLRKYHKDGVKLWLSCSLADQTYAGIVVSSFRFDVSPRHLCSFLPVFQSKLNANIEVGSLLRVIQSPRSY
jgi:hypothetical protein